MPSGPPSGDSKAFDLQAVAREVQALGALHLDRKHDAKTFKSNQLQQLGIKLPKKPRLSAALGLRCHMAVTCGSCASTRLCVCAGAKIGVASLHKSKRREEKQEQELIDTGMKSLRGRSKRKATSHKGRKEKGLNEAQGFKAGVMRVKPNAMKASGMKKQGQKQKLGKGRGNKRK